MAAPRGKRQAKLNALSFAIMLEEMMKRPMTADALAQATGLHRTTIDRTLAAMYRRSIVHVAGWSRDSQGRPVIRVFGFGYGLDAKRPTKPRREVNRDYARKMRARRVTASSIGTVYVAGIEVHAALPERA